MSSDRAVFPALPPPSFPPVALLPARRLTAASVIVPEQHDHHVTTTTTTSPTVQFDDRSSSVEGNILCIDEIYYFWLQRIVRTTANGKIRAGFCVQPPSTTTTTTTSRSSNRSGATTTSSDSAAWEVEVVHRPSNKDTNENQSIEAQVQMVAIRIEDATDFMDSPELAALSYVATTLHQDNDNDTHIIQNAMLLAADESNVYIVTPYDVATSMSLRDYCLAQSHSIVSEFQAREFTKQIFKGIATLQNMKLYHGNLTLDNIIVRPNPKRNCSRDHGVATDNDSMCFDCSIRNFENAIRVPCSNATTTDDDDNNATVMVHRLLLTEDTPPSTIRRKGIIGNVQFVAPEILTCTSRKDQRKEQKQQQPNAPFDAYAVDLWAVGVMMLSMLLGNDNIFVAPIVADRIYQQISMQEQLKEYYNKIRATTTTTTTLPTVSDHALDLLQQMLRIDPEARPTLREIQQHAWFHC